MAHKVPLKGRVEGDISEIIQKAIQKIREDKAKEQNSKEK